MTETPPTTSEAPAPFEQVNTSGATLRIPSLGTTLYPGDTITHTLLIPGCSRASDTATATPGTPPPTTSATAPETAAPLKSVADSAKPDPAPGPPSSAGPAATSTTEKE